MGLLLTHACHEVRSPEGSDYCICIVSSQSDFHVTILKRNSDVMVPDEKGGWELEGRAGEEQQGSCVTEACYSLCVFISLKSYGTQICMRCVQ